MKLLVKVVLELSLVLSLSGDEVVEGVGAAGVVAACLVVLMDVDRSMPVPVPVLGALAVVTLPESEVVEGLEISPLPTPSVEADVEAEVHDDGPAIVYPGTDPVNVRFQSRHIPCEAPAPVAGGHSVLVFPPVVFFQRGISVVVARMVVVNVVAAPFGLSVSVSGLAVPAVVPSVAWAVALPVAVAVAMAVDEELKAVDDVAELSPVGKLDVEVSCDDSEELRPAGWEVELSIEVEEPSEVIDELSPPVVVEEDCDSGTDVGVGWLVEAVSPARLSEEEADVWLSLMILVELSPTTTVMVMKPDCVEVRALDSVAFKTVAVLEVRFPLSGTMAVMVNS